MMRLAALVLALAACSDDVVTITATEVVLETPADGDDVYTLEPFTIRAHASNGGGILRVLLKVADRTVKTCTGGEGFAFETVACEGSVDSRDFAALQDGGTLHVSVVAFDAEERDTSTSVDVRLTPLRVKFVKPGPPVAGLVDVSGTSTLLLEATGELPVQHVAVTFDADVPLQEFDAEPYSSELDWQAFVGAGTHTLTAVATDSQQRTARARLKIRVAP